MSDFKPEFKGIQEYIDKYGSMGSHRYEDDMRKFKEGDYLMTFSEAYNESLRTGRPIKRKTQALYGVIINRLVGNTTVIAKFVNKSNVYNLDLEDITAKDWQLSKED